jgi:hypothetical protein
MLTNKTNKFNKERQSTSCVYLWDFWKTFDDSFKFCSNISAINNRSIVKTVLNNEIIWKINKEII